MWNVKGGKTIVRFDILNIMASLDPTWDCSAKRFCSRKADMASRDTADYFPNSLTDYVLKKKTGWLSIPSQSEPQWPRQALDSPAISTDDHLKFQGLDASAGAQLMEVWQTSGKYTQLFKFKLSTTCTWRDADEKWWNLWRSWVDRSETCWHSGAELLPAGVGCGDWTSPALGLAQPTWHSGSAGATTGLTCHGSQEGGRGRVGLGWGLMMSFLVWQLSRAVAESLQHSE